MKIKYLLVTILGFLVFNVSGVAYATIINLDAYYGSTVVPMNLAAGYYEVTPTEDCYIAWNAWGSTTVPAGDTGYDSQSGYTGWINNYNITIDSVTTLYSDGLRYNTPELALFNAVGASFTLATAEIVDFWIGDSYYYDNVGGMSLDVQLVNAPVPEPATMLLFGLGLLGLAGVNRRKQ